MKKELKKRQKDIEKEYKASQKRQLLQNYAEIQRESNHSHTERRRLNNELANELNND